MTTPPPTHDDLADTTALPESVRAEAAVWLARLHSDQRSEETERDFRAWLASDALHAAAFERMTNTWEATGILREARETGPSTSPPRPK
jgi:ferric-dicitrate binding protein FerR (iron transport regulator)